MGNWRTVTIIGSVPADEVAPLREAVLFDYMADDVDWDMHGPLCFTKRGSLFGLHEWVARGVSASGNLVERDYSVEDVAEHLRKLVAVAPGMSLKVHCGDDWEEERCIATITVDAGQVSIGEPEIDAVGGVSVVGGMGRMFRMLHDG